MATSSNGSFFLFDMAILPHFLMKDFLLKK